MEEDSKETGLSNVIRIDDERVRDHLGPIVRGPASVVIITSP
jgi:hypothetical protein